MLVTAAGLDALRVGFRLDYNRGIGSYKPKWNQVATLIPSVTRENRYGWIKDFPMLREWFGDRVVKSVSEGDYTVVNRPFEGTVGVKKTDIEDDLLGVYKPMMEGLGRSAMVFPDELVFNLLAAGATTPCWDGQYFFDAEHPVGDDAGSIYSNVQGPTGGDPAGAPWILMDTSQPLKPLIYQERKKPEFVAMTDLTTENVFRRAEFEFGVDLRANAGFGFPQMAFMSTAPLNGTYYSALRQAMTSQVSDTGRKLNITPNIIVVGPSRRAEAKLLFQTIIAEATTNIYLNDVDIVETAYLP